MRITVMKQLEIIRRVLEEDKCLYANLLINIDNLSMHELVTFQNIAFDMETFGFVIETDLVYGMVLPTATH